MLCSCCQHTPTHLPAYKHTQRECRHNRRAEERLTLKTGLEKPDDATMQLLLRVFLMLSLATLLLASRKGRRVSINFGSDTRLKGKMARLILDPSVLPQIVSTFDSSIANMSLSPWTYRDSYEESRVPKRISHAQCLTSGCLSLQGGGEDAALEAKPIHYQVLVLHRVSRQQKRKNKKGRKARNKYLFRLGTEVVSVGCTCVRPSVVSQP